MGPKWFSFIKPWFTNIREPAPMRKMNVAKLNAASEYRVEAIFIRMNFELQCYEIGSWFLGYVDWWHVIHEKFSKIIFRNAVLSRIKLPQEQ